MAGADLASPGALAEASLLKIMKGALATFLRVNVALVLAAAWTIPAGVAIGFHPRLARIAPAPLLQIAASVPATARSSLVLLLALVRMGAAWELAQSR